MSVDKPYQAGDADTRPWGRWQVLAIGQGFIIKQIEVEADQVLSLQSHAHRNEHWTIIKGQAEVTLGEQTYQLEADGRIFIPKGEKHRIRNTGAGRMSFIEIQTGPILSEQDIVRYDDEYGRA